MRSVNSFGLFPRSGIMPRKSLYVRSVISHFVEMGDLIIIQTWHMGRLLLLKRIVSEVQYEKPTSKKKKISSFECVEFKAIF